MRTPCIVSGCNNSSTSDPQPEPGWALLKVSAVDGGVLVSRAQGVICPDHFGGLPALRNGAEIAAAAAELEAAAADPVPAEATRADPGALE